MIKHIFKLIWNKKKANSLIIIEIFLSFLVLFAVVGYVLYNLDNIQKPLGFESKDRWLIQLDNQVELLQDSAEKVTILQNLRRDLQSMDNIEEVSFLSSIYPFSNNNWRNSFQSGQLSINSNMMPVDLGYASLMGVEVSEGRWFTEDDLNAPHRAMVVNREWLDAYEGQSILDSVYTSGDHDYKVVGIVDYNKYMGEFEKLTETMYFLVPPEENSSGILLKMRSGTTAEAEETISKLINAVTKTSASTIATLDKLKVDKSRHQWVLMIGLLSICGFLCINVALGLFGVLWYNIHKRRSEIGLRQALGAHSSTITVQFILEILFLTAIAVGLGLFFAVQLPLLDVTEYPDSLFYKAMFYATLIILVLVLICALLPSIQASRIRPAIALHED